MNCARSWPSGTGRSCCSPRRRGAARSARPDGRAAGGAAAPAGSELAQQLQAPVESGVCQAAAAPAHVNLLDRLDGHRDEVLRFAEDLRVPATTNGSEQDVRPVKIRMKTAGCLRTMAGAEAFCRLRSYLSTARKHGHTGFTARACSPTATPGYPHPTNELSSHALRKNRLGTRYRRRRAVRCR